MFRYEAISYDETAALGTNGSLGAGAHADWGSLTSPVGTAGAGPVAPGMPMATLVPGPAAGTPGTRCGASSWTKSLARRPGLAVAPEVPLGP